MTEGQMPASPSASAGADKNGGLHHGKETVQHEYGQTASVVPVGESIFLPATELLQCFHAGTLSPVQVIEDCIARIEKGNEDLNAFVLTRFTAAREAADEATRRYRDGTARPLEGVPIAIKDLSDFEAGVRTTFGSRIFTEDFEFIPDAPSQHVHRLLEAGAISLGKTATPEFGHKGTTASPAWGDTSTPFRIGINAGGSSGGAAAATAAFMVAAAQGTDAGGSIRIPAAQTATVGLKLTHGQVPTNVAPLSVNPYLHTGPITRTVADAALLGDVLAQPWIGDPTGVPRQTRLSGALNRGAEGLRIAFSPDLDLYPADQDVMNLVREAAHTFRQAGAEVVETPVGLGGITIGPTPDQQRPLTQDDLSRMWRELMGVMYSGSVVDFFAENGIDMRRHADKMTPEFRELIDLGDSVSGRHIRNLEVVQAKIVHAFYRLWTEKEFDLLITPTLACSPHALPNAGDGSTLGPARIGGVPVERTIGWCMTVPFNYTGEPVVSVPAGFLDGLPVGMQIIGPRWADERVVAAAAAYERLRPWHDRYPRDMGLYSLRSS
ncbi:amidase [Streptomyces sp. NPDC096198]|uniref:amidase n=1 Tax=Streptomyces sp. NPDC096198 TaxID=3366080 RepID=UPI0038194172